MISELDRQLLQAVRDLLQGLLDDWTCKPKKRRHIVELYVLRFVELCREKPDGVLPGNNRHYKYETLESVVGQLQQERLVPAATSPEDFFGLVLARLHTLAGRFPDPTFWPALTENERAVLYPCHAYTPEEMRIKFVRRFHGYDAVPEPPRIKYQSWPGGRRRSSRR